MAASPFTIQSNNSFKDILSPIPVNLESTGFDDLVVSKEEMLVLWNTAMALLIQKLTLQSQSEFFMHLIQESKWFTPLTCCLILNMKNNLN